MRAITSSVTENLYVAVEGWTREQAVEEMTRGGFRFHRVWKNLPSWIEKLDIEKLAKEAGIKE